MTWIVIYIVAPIMASLSLIFGGSATAVVSSPMPAILEAPKGVVSHAGGYTAPTTVDVRGGSNGAAIPSDPVSPAVEATSFINPNQSFMEVHEPIEPEVTTPEVTEPETKPVYIEPKEETPGQVDGTEYATQGY